MDGCTDVSRGVKRRKHRQGSLLDQAARADLAPGPATLAEMFNFPSDLVRTCFAAPQFEDRCRRLLQHGIVEHSDYSGIHAEREAKRLLLQTLLEECDMNVPHIVSKTCDIDSHAQTVLLEASRELDGGESCVFPDVHCQIPAEAQAYIQALQPQPEDSKEVKRAAHEAVRRWLLDNASAVVNQDSLQHGDSLVRLMCRGLVSCVCSVVVYSNILA